MGRDSRMFRRRSSTPPGVALLGVVAALFVLYQVWENRAAVFETLSFILVFGIIAVVAFKTMLGRR
jgi:hypothetical protein